MQIPKNRLDEVIAHMFKYNMPGVRSLLSNNGVNTDGMSDKNAQIAFLKAIKDSEPFRQSASAFMADLVQTQATFIAQPLLGFVNQPQLNYVDNAHLNETGPSNESGFDYTAPATTSTPTTTEKTKSSFWSTLGGLASKENLQSLFNTGLNVTSTSLQNKANKESEERALELERLRLQQIQAQKELSQSGGGSKMSTGAIIGIVAGGLLVVGLVIWAVRKKR